MFSELRKQARREGGKRGHLTQASTLAVEARNGGHEMDYELSLFY